jgi:hypothetical protein
MSGSIDEKVETGSSKESKVESRASSAPATSALLIFPCLATENIPSLHKEDASPVDAKLDKHGLALIPQPSSDPSDPLNFPQWLKIAILLQVSFMAGLGPFNQAVVNPGWSSHSTRRSWTYYRI